MPASAVFDSPITAIVMVTCSCWLPALIVLYYRVPRCVGQGSNNCYYVESSGPIANGTAASTVLFSGPYALFTSGPVNENSAAVVSDFDGNGKSASVVRFEILVQ